MDKKLIIDQMISGGVIPVIRSDSRNTARALIDAVVAGGVTSVEITMTIPDAIALIKDVAEKLEDHIAVGAGTVCSAEDARRCVDAGAVFVVSPVADLEVIEVCKSAKVPVIPGALTPSEIFAAWKAGADLVKIFPANALGGPRYIRSTKAVFPHIRFLPTGGVTLENAGDFVAAGAAAVGVGSDLADPRLVAAAPEEVSKNTAKFLEAVASARALRKST